MSNDSLEPNSSMLRSSLESVGFVWMRNAVSKAEIDKIVTNLPKTEAPGFRIDDGFFEFTRIEAMPFVQQMASQWSSLRLVRAVYFSKEAENNWSLPWHQDKIIQVNTRVDKKGFKNWSLKNGQWHCEPPTEVLNSILFVRLHLDTCSAENGAMEIVPQSHIHGKLSSAQSEIAARTSGAVTTNADSGDVLILPMLCVHRSGISKTGTPRRTLRLDFATKDLPPPMAWPRQHSDPDLSLAPDVG